ncbi:hypothetical protein GCM10020220_036070 [Nonomuraea rubra]
MHGPAGQADDGVLVVLDRGHHRRQAVEERIGGRLGPDRDRQAAVLRRARVAAHLTAGHLREHLPAQADAEHRHPAGQRLPHQPPRVTQPRGPVVLAGQVAAAEHDHGVVAEAIRQRRTGVGGHDVEREAGLLQPAGQAAGAAARAVLDDEDVSHRRPPP